MKDIKDKIDIVKNDILSRFPNCAYTIMITLWDDDTSKIECRHGNDEGTKIYCSTYYDNKLEFYEIDVDNKVSVIDESGNEKFMYMTYEKPIMPVNFWEEMRNVRIS